MRIVRDGLWLCDDCLMVAVNGDDSGVPEEYKAAVHTGVEMLGVGLVPDFDGETGVRGFSSCECDACGTRLVGQRHRFAVLGPEMVAETLDRR